MRSAITKRNLKKVSRPRKCVFCQKAHVVFDPCEKAIEFFNSTLTKEQIKT